MMLIKGPFFTDVMRFARLPNGITSSLEFFNKNQEHIVVRMVITKKMSTLIDCFLNLEISSYRYNFRPRKVWFFDLFWSVIGIGESLK